MNCKSKRTVLLHLISCRLPLLLPAGGLSPDSTTTPPPAPAAHLLPDQPQAPAQNAQSQQPQFTLLETRHLAFDNQIEFFQSQSIKEPGL